MTDEAGSQKHHPDSRGFLPVKREARYAGFFLSGTKSNGFATMNDVMATYLQRRATAESKTRGIRLRRNIILFVVRGSANLFRHPGTWVLIAPLVAMAWINPLSSPISLSSRLNSTFSTNAEGTPHLSKIPRISNARPYVASSSLGDGDLPALSLKLERTLSLPTQRTFP